VTLETELELRPAGTAGVVFKSLSAGSSCAGAGDRRAPRRESRKPPGRRRCRQDSLGYQWLVVHDRDFEDLVTGVHLVASELGAHGFGEQLLAAIFSFWRRGEERPVYLIYGFKRGAFWPFVPTGKEQERDNARAAPQTELQGELPFRA
jgi:hypothetical protein